MATVKNKGSIRRVSRCTTSLLALLPVVMALSVAEQAAAQQAASTNSGIDEVVITAQHRAQSDKDTAEAVSVISPDNLDEFSAGGADITFLDGRVPGLYALSTYGRTYPMFSIRGVSNPNFDYNSSQPVSLIYDDVVLLNPILKSFPVFDTVGLEVAKGPQGTLYGADTPGGVVKIDSQKPTDTFGGYGDISYGTFETTSFNGAVNLPLVPGKLAMRLSVNEDYRENWVTNTYTPDYRSEKSDGYNDEAARLQLLWTPDDDTSVLLNLHGRNLRGTATLFRGNAELAGTNDLAPGFKDSIDSYGGIYPQKEESRGATLTVDHDFGGVKLTSITGWEGASIQSRGDLPGGYVNPTTGVGNVPFDFDSQDTIPSLNQVSQEIRLSSDVTSRLFDQGGAFIFHDVFSDRQSQFNNPVDSPLASQANYHSSHTIAGIFDSATYKVTDDFSVGAGARYSGDWSGYYTALSSIGGFTPTSSNNGVGSTAVTWDVSANYKINDDLSAYARVARGGKGPAIEGRLIGTEGATVTTAQPEVMTSKEVGVKSTWWDRRAKLDLDVYEWDNRDAQLTTVGGNQNVIGIQNVHNVQGYGLEAEGELKPFDQLLLTAGGAYTHTEIQAPGVFVQPCADGCTVTSPMVNGLVSINHEPLQNAPLVSANWTGRFTQPIDGSQGVFLFTDWTWRGKVLTTPYNSVESNVKPLLLGGLRIGYENYDNDLEVSGFVRNIMNNVQVVYISVDFVPGDLNAVTNDPRTFGIEIKKRF